MVATSPNASRLAYSGLDSQRDYYDTVVGTTMVDSKKPHISYCSGLGFIQSYLPTQSQLFPYAPIFPCPVIVREQL